MTFEPLLELSCEGCFLGEIQTNPSWPEYKYTMQFTNVTRLVRAHGMESLLVFSPIRDKVLFVWLHIQNIKVVWTTISTAHKICYGLIHVFTFHQP